MAEIIAANKSEAGKLTGQDLKKILIGAGIVGVGASLTYLDDYMPLIAGMVQSIPPEVMTGIWSVLFNALRKWVSTNYNLTV